MTNFAIMGVGGYVAPRHLEAIKANGGTVVAAFDPNDSVGILDRYNLDCEYFREYERFERYMELGAPRTGSSLFDDHVQASPGFIQFLSVCSPNYLHDSHIRLGLRTGCMVICEKPLVITPSNLGELRRAEERYERKVYTILQLRHHEALQKVKNKLDAGTFSARTFHDVSITYVTPRGAWYDFSWKGDESKSGGVAMNIGVHLFDVMGWLFGAVQEVIVHCREPRRAAGCVRFERAIVRWFLSVDEEDMNAFGKAKSERRIVIDEEEIEFSEGFTDLHTKAYSEILAGRGFGIEDARPSIDLVHKVRLAKISDSNVERHPRL